MATFYIGLKIGSTNTVIYKSGSGVVLKEPTLVAVSKNSKFKEIKEFGLNAKKIIGKNPDDIAIFSPIVCGKIQYEDLAVQMLKGFLKKIFTNVSIGQKIKAILCVPIGLTSAEIKQFEIVCFKAGITDVHTIPDVLAFAVGNGMNDNNEKSRLIVNIGGDTTNIAIISNLEILTGINLSIGGAVITIALAKYIEDTYNIKVTKTQAESIKTEICALYENYDLSIEISGRNIKTQMYEKIDVRASTLYPVVEYYYGRIADAILAVISSCDSALVSEIQNEGIYFYGGATAIVGLENFMFRKTNQKIKISTNTQLDMLGCGELIKYPQILKKILKNL